MSFLKRLFGGGNKSAKAHTEAEHKGFKIECTPMPESGQYRVCALISKEIGGEVKEHTLIRADVCGSIDDASEIAMRKSRQIIDEQGERIFG